MAKFKVKVGGPKKKPAQAKAGGLFPKGTPAVGGKIQGGKKKVAAKSVLSRITGGGVGKAKPKSVSVVSRLGPLAVGSGAVKKNALRARLANGPTVTRHGGARAIRVVSAIRSPPGKGRKGVKDDLRGSLGGAQDRGRAGARTVTFDGSRAARGADGGTQRVGEFLRSLGLGKYAGKFQKEEIDVVALRRVTDKDLQTMGVPLGPRKKILAAKGSV